MSESYLEITTTITLVSNLQKNTDSCITKIVTDTSVSPKQVTAAIVGHCETLLKPSGLGVTGFRDH